MRKGASGFTLVNFPTYVTYRENLNPVKYNMVIDTCAWMAREFENVYHFKMDGDPRFGADGFLRWRSFK